MANLANQDDFIRTALRLPRDLHAQVQLAAEKAGRSMNAELIHRLEMSFVRGQVLEINVHADMGVNMNQLNEVLREISPHIPPDQALSITMVRDKEQ